MENYGGKEAIRCSCNGFHTEHANGDSLQMAIPLFMIPLKIFLACILPDATINPID